MNRTGTTPTPFGFVGAQQYQTDGDSELQLLGHRYYDPSIGRFLSQDPIQDGTNWYAYCDSNPLTGIDPNGLQRLPKQPDLSAGHGQRIPQKSVTAPQPIPPDDGDDGDNDDDGM